MFATGKSGYICHIFYKLKEISTYEIKKILTNCGRPVFITHICFTVRIQEKAGRNLSLIKLQKR